MAGECQKMSRAQLAEDLLVESIAFVPVLGGVIEYGTTHGPSTATWTSEEDAFRQIIPNEEIEMAISEGATYIIFWKGDVKAGTYNVGAAFERPANKLSVVKDTGESYITKSGETTLAFDGVGPVAVCGRAGSVLEVKDTATYPDFKRREVALEWGVGKFTVSPLETGVLEYGTVTKDKRETTRGAEYQEAVRQYRRTVFMHGDWVDHRSTDRFFRSLTSVLESGVIRARERELTMVASIAAFTVVWNILASGYTDFEMIKHSGLIDYMPPIALPLSIFSLTGPSLGLLLVFRTNTAYGRWDDARKQWGSIINNCRSLVREANTFMSEE
mmetsp:Transcript_69921/g.210081  ORF Transcript_69921/g.210081 Transcript_69921/m.210081 type:complete len:329 (+) Transcript_69921:250-1236(+)